MVVTEIADNPLRHAEADAHAAGISSEADDNGTRA